MVSEPLDAALLSSRDINFTIICSETAHREAPLFTFALTAGQKFCFRNFDHSFCGLRSVQWHLCPFSLFGSGARLLGCANWKSFNVGGIASIGRYAFCSLAY